MKTLLANVGLALLFMALVGRVTGLGFVTGLILSFAALAATRRGRGQSPYFRKVPEGAAFAVFFLKELVVSSLRVAYDIVTPTLHMRPAIIAVPLDAKTDAEITLLACLITLTPGTLTLDVSADRKLLYVHAMFVRDAERTRTNIKNGFERRVLGLLR